MHLLRTNRIFRLITYQRRKGEAERDFASASFCAVWGRSSHAASTFPPSFRQFSRLFSLLPLVMSTHKADDSPSKTLNGMANGFGPKTPFLIGVAGGTASGKVSTGELIGCWGCYEVFGGALIGL